MRYRVGMVQQVWEECTVYIEADTPEQAEQKALDLALNGNVEWRFLEANETPEAVAVDAEGSIAKMAVD
jgi:uncharacterized protein with GYD domain